MNVHIPRFHYLDSMRIISMCAVVVIHTAAQYWSSTSVYSFEWSIYNLYDSAMRWAVPVFVMISGAIFLNPRKELTIKRIYSKYILRIIIIILFWGLLYAAISSPPTELSLVSIWQFTKVVLLGHYHMWFLYMIIGLYIITPLLRCITHGEQLTRYFLAIALIINSIIPFVTAFEHFGIINDINDKLLLRLPIGYSLYYVLGHWLNSHPEIFRKGWGVTLFFIGFALSFGLTEATALYAGEPSQRFYEYLSLPVVFESIGVFLIGRNALHNPKHARSINLLSNCSLGVYLVHILVLTKLGSWGIDSEMCNPIIAVPLTAFIAIVISFAVTLILKQIPIFNKYCI